MKINFSFLAATLYAISPIYAQAPAIQWQNTIGGSGFDILYALQQTADGGYIVGGLSDSNISGDKTENSNGFWDYWVVKVDATGTIQWQNTIGGSGYESNLFLQQTIDGGYFLGGTSDSNISGDKTENSLGKEDYWVLKLDATGIIQWQNTIGGNYYEVLSSIRQTADGGYILGGGSSSNISGDKTENSLGGLDFWVVKLDATGDIQWQNTIGGNGLDEIRSILQTADGGYILGGTSESTVSGDKTENSLGTRDYWVVKLDTTGTIQWQNTIGGNGYDILTCLQQTTDGGYIIGGYSGSDISGDKTENKMGDDDYWVVKLNATGSIQWQNTIGGNGYESLTYIQQIADGGYILGGFSNSNISGDKTEDCLGSTDYWVLKLDATGAIQWQNTIGGLGDDLLYSFQQTTDDGYILGGCSDSDISIDKTENSLGGKDFWIIKLAPETVPTGEAPSALGSLTIYPNPTSDVLFLRSEATITLCLHNAFGQILSTQTIQNQGKIHLSPYPNGIYFLVEIETGIVHKILKVK